MLVNDLNGVNKKDTIKIDENWNLFKHKIKIMTYLMTKIRKEKYFNLILIWCIHHCNFNIHGWIYMTNNNSDGNLDNYQMQ